MLWSENLCIVIIDAIEPSCSYWKCIIIDRL